MNCKKYQILIEKYLDGIINDAELARLKTHTEKCVSCRKEFQRAGKMDSIIRSAFSPATAASQASDSILSKLATHKVEFKPTLLFRKWIPAAAWILLAVGFLLGFGLAKTGTTKTATSKAMVPIQVTKLEGTVLVKHQDSDIWEQLRAGSNIYLGDTFYSTAKATVSLEFEDKSTIQLNPNSTLTLKLYNSGTEFYLEHGVAAAALNSPHPPFFISTPQGRIEALGTEFTVTVE